MRIVKVKDIYKVDRISNTNSKAWLAVLEQVDLTSPVILDFDGIDLVSPWTNLDFKKLLSNENVHLRIYNAEKTAQTINMMCVLDGIKTSRIENINVIIEDEIPKAQLKIMKMGEELQTYFNTDGEIPRLEICRRFSQIGSVNTVNYIKEAINIFCKKHGVNQVILATNDIFIQDNIVDLLASLILEFGHKQIKLSIDSENDDIIKRLKLCLHNQINKKYDSDSREESFRMELKPGTVGLLTRYKRSKALDSFGRQGNGVPVSCRVSIYMGLVKNQNTGRVSAKFRTFDKNTLFTRTHWGLEHDGELLERLVEDTVVIDLMDVGLKGLFLGTQYHFMLPYQKEPSETVTMYDVDGDGKTVRVKMTIPERAKAVFDDFSISYNKEELNRAIVDTRRYLDSIE